MKKLTKLKKQVETWWFYLHEDDKDNLTFLFEIFLLFVLVGFCFTIAYYGGR